MNIQQWIQSIRNKLNWKMRLEKARQWFIASKNFLLGLLRKLVLWFARQWQSLAVYDRYIKKTLWFVKDFLVMQTKKITGLIVAQWKNHHVYQNAFVTPCVQIKKYYLLITDFIAKQHQKAHAFLTEQANKKETYQQTLKTILSRGKERIKHFGKMVVKKSQVCFSILSAKINQHEKLGNFLKKCAQPVHMASRYLTEQYRVITKKVAQYEWVSQLYEASQQDVRKITLISSLFINLLALALPMSLLQVYDRIIPNQAYVTLTFLSIGVAIAIILEMILRILRSYINLWADAKYEYQLSKKAFHNLLHVPLYVYEDTDIGTRIKQFSVLDQMRGFYNNQFLVAICDIPFLLLFLFVIYYIGGWLVWVPIIIIARLTKISFAYMDAGQSLLEKKLTLESRENDFLVNVLDHIHTAKSFGIENLLIRRYERMQNTTVETNYDSTVQTGDLSRIKSVASQSNIIFMAALGGILVIQGKIAIGSMLASILLGGRLMIPVVNGITAFNRWKMINLIRQQLDNILRIPVTENIELQEIKGEISLKNVGYLIKSDRRRYWAFQEVTLTILPRTVVSIIGESLEDREKLLKILAAVIRPTTGEYLIDGKNVDLYQNYSLRTKIIYLSKTGALFHGSIMDNLSAFDQKLIPVAERFAKQLGLDAVLSKLPQGYDTMVGDKAVEALPASAMNLIYIVRALVKKPKIILFDEADMDLDVNATTRMIQLLTILKEIATIVILPISQETIQFSDNVYELKNGKLDKVTTDDRSTLS